MCKSNERTYQIQLLKEHKAQIEDSAVLINVLHNRTALDQLEDCEIQSLLRLADRSLWHGIQEIEERIAIIEALEVNHG